MRAHPFVPFLLAALAWGCDRAPSAPTPPVSPPPPADGFYSEAELRDLGVTVTAVEGGRSLVCGGEDLGTCVCLEPLPCAAAGDCATFDENVRAFRDALAHPAEGRAVHCRRAETGRCGDLRYFDFDGDIERHEIRWFDASGRLVAQRNWTDYPAYCGGKSRVMFQGRVPKCASAARDELICGEAAASVPTPVDDLLRRAGVAR